MTLISRWLLLCALSLCSLAQAQDWPSKPIKLIVPFPPGGPTDTIGREIAEILRAELKQPVLVDNRAGGNGTIGLGVLAKAPSDGYTLGLLAITVATTPHLQTVPFDAFKDFAPVTNVASTTPIILANKDAPFKSLAELTAYAKANPGKVAYGTPGVATIPHLAMELFQSQAGVKLNHIPYKGAAQQIQDLIGGATQLDAQSSVVLAQGQVKAGRVQPLAVLTEKRSPLLPEVPTAVEAGYPKMVVAPWFGLGAPAGVDPAIVARLHAAVMKGLATQEVQDKFAANGIVITSSASPAAFAAYIKDEYERWGAFIKSTGIKAE